MKTHPAPYVIKAGIPIPTINRGGTTGPRRGRTTGVLYDMSPGDSIVIAKNKEASFRQTAKRSKMPITTRKMPDGTLRLWRITKD